MLYTHNMVTTGFRAKQVLQLVSITYRQLHYWARSGLVVPSGEFTPGTGHNWRWSFRDLVALRAVADLRHNGASLQAIRQAAQTLRDRGDDHPLAGNVLLVSAGGDIACVVEFGQVAELLTGAPGQTFMIVPVGTFEEELIAAAERLPA
jgi:DNA-binding transcriptional MerR regulator